MTIYRLEKRAERVVSPPAVNPVELRGKREVYPTRVKLIFGRRDVGEQASLELSWLTAARLAAGLAGILSKGGAFSQRHFTVTLANPLVEWKNRLYFIKVEALTK